MITVTDSAVKHLRTLLAERAEAAGTGLRIFVENGGCSGMQYGMSFDQPRADDEVTGREGVCVLVDPKSATFLTGSVVDYEDSLTGTGFRIQNPRAKRTCGCGTSFEPDTARSDGRRPLAGFRAAYRLSPMRRRSSSLQDDLLRTPVEYDQPRKHDHLFLWTVFLLLLVGFSMACWIGSYLIFSRPELPFSYKILRKIKKIDPPAVFKVNAAPPGEFLTAEQLYDRYSTMSGPALRALNRDLERAYLRNYPIGGLVPYVKGRFTIMESYQLASSDFVPSGAVVLAESSDFSKVMIEQLYTSSPADAPLIKRNLQTGMDIELRRTFELTAVLHVAKLTDGHMQLTVVPINYGHYLYTGTSGGFDLHPPTELNVSAGWPIIRNERLTAASEAYLDYRTRSGGGLLVAHKKEGEKPAPTALKGVDPAIVDDTPTPPPAPAATPQVAQANLPPGKPGRDGKKPTPAPANAVASPTPLLAQNNPPVRSALPVDGAPMPTPRAAVPTPRPVIKAVGSSGGLNGGVSLQPFLAGEPAVAPAAGEAASVGSSTRNWATYAPGRMPSGRDVRVNEIATLSRKGSLGDEPVYLTGQFVVRAVGENKAKGIRNAVLRSSGSDGNVRVIVEYPSDRALPAEGSEISRDDQRPYQIMDVRQVADGTLNVFAREISE